MNKPELVLAKIIKEIVYSRRSNSSEEAQEITSSLAVILERTYWDNYLFNHRLHNCLNEMLKLYLLEGFSRSSFALKFRMEIKNCLRNFISNMKDNKGEALVCSYRKIKLRGAVKGWKEAEFRLLVKGEVKVAQPHKEKL